MKVFRLDKKTGEKKFVEYPRKDMGRIDGLDKDIMFYLTIDDAKPEYDTVIQELAYTEEFTGEMHTDYPSIHLARGRWSVVQKELKPLEDIKESLVNELREVVLEMSTVMTAVENIYKYDKDKTAIPDGFNQMSGIISDTRKRVLKDIESFTDSESAVRYKIRTEEADNLLTQLKSYL